MTEEQTQNQLQKQEQAFREEKGLLLAKLQDVDIREMRLNMQLAQLKEEIKF